MTASAQLRIHHTKHPSTVIDGVLRALEAEATRCRFSHLQTIATERESSIQAPVCHAPSGRDDAALIERPTLQRGDKPIPPPWQLWSKTFWRPPDEVEHPLERSPT